MASEKFNLQNREKSKLQSRAIISYDDGNGHTETSEFKVNPYYFTACTVLYQESKKFYSWLEVQQ